MYLSLGKVVGNLVALSKRDHIFPVRTGNKQLGLDPDVMPRLARLQCFKIENGPYDHLVLKYQYTTHIRAS